MINWESVNEINQCPEAFLKELGEIFAVFDERTQDSGNISYGVKIGDARYFVKTAGLIQNSNPYLQHPQRIELLYNAARLSRECAHPALARLRHVVDASSYGPLLVYEWAEGSLLGAPRAKRDDPRSPYQRFLRLGSVEIARALDTVFNLHHELAKLGWVALDFYDGCLIYDFERRWLTVVDLDTYRDHPSINDMGRMFGSTRFMAPEEFELGAPLDSRTNVFTMGRTIAVFLSDGSMERSKFRGSEPLFEVMRRACREKRTERYESMDEFYSAWCEARLNS